MTDTPAVTCTVRASNYLGTSVASAASNSAVVGTVPGARNISLPALLESVGGLDRKAPTVVYCAGGYRSAIAASLLRSHGFDDVSDLVGGYAAWVARCASRGTATAT